MPLAFVINMEVDVERQKLLSPGETSNDESGRVRRVCQDGEDMIREDTTYQAIPEDHSIEIETNVCFDNLYVIDKHNCCFYFSNGDRSINLLILPIGCEQFDPRRRS